jgi:hypothetical protein
MNVVAIGFCFLVAFVLTVVRGAGVAFVFVYLPAILLICGVTGFPILGLPDPTAQTAAVYGILAGSVLRSPVRIRLVLVDYLFVLLLLAYVVSAITTEYVYTGVSIFGSLILDLVAPYFITRFTMERRSLQRSALLVIVGCTLVIAFFALVEARLSPAYYAKLLTQIGLRDGYVDFADTRFGFFRAASTFRHPIDLGICGGLIALMIALLAVRSGVGLRDLRVRIGLAAASVCWLVAFSFTSYIGLAAGVGLLALLTTFRPARRRLVTGVLVAIAVGFAIAATLANTPLGERTAPGGSFAASLWIRHLIIQQAWESVAGAGFFGWGRLIQVGDLESIDNAYLVIGIQRGWVPLALWLAVPVALAALCSRALRRARSAVAIQAVLLGFSGVFGTMVAMFTVWLGFAYQSLFVVAIALTVNAAQHAMRPAAAKRATPPSVPAPLTATA